MAHSCPECGQACYCGGDIDDAFDVDESAEENCDHACEDGPEDVDDGYYPSEEAL